MLELDGRLSSTLFADELSSPHAISIAQEIMNNVVEYLGDRII